VNGEGREVGRHASHASAVVTRDAISLFCQPMSRKRRTVADEPFLLVRTSTADLGAGGVVASHVHDWHQLVHVRSGLMTVRTGAGSWIAPPTWAIWIPAGTDHGIRFTGASALRTCYGGATPARYF